MTSFLFFLVLSLSCVSTTVAADSVDGHPTLKSAEIEIVEGSLLSQYWKVATVRFDVGQVKSNQSIVFVVVAKC